MSEKLTDFLSFRHRRMRSFVISVLLPILAVSIILSVYYMNQTLTHRRASDRDMLESTASIISGNLAEMEHMSFTPYLYSDVEQAMIHIRNGFLNPGAASSKSLSVARSERTYTTLFTKLLHTASQGVYSISFYPFGTEFGSSYTIARNSPGLKYARADDALVERMRERASSSQADFIFLHMEDTDESMYTLLRVIRDMDAQKDLGVLRIDTGTAELCRCMEAVPVTQNSFLVLLDSRDCAIYSIGNSEEELLRMAREGRVSTWKDGRLYDFHVLRIQDWELIYVCATFDLFAPFARSVSIILWVLALAFAATYLLYRRQSADTFESIDRILVVSCMYVEGPDLWELYKTLGEMESRSEYRYGIPGKTVCRFGDVRFTPAEDAFLKQTERLAEAYQETSEAGCGKALASMENMQDLRVTGMDVQTLVKLLGVKMDTRFSWGGDAASLCRQPQRNRARIYKNASSIKLDHFTEITQYVDKHYMEDLSLSSLAEKMNLTPNYFSKIFHDRMGKTFSRYLAEVRIAQARRILLIRKDVRIKEVSLMVGYSSSRYFTNVFKKMTGCYPSEFRKMYGGEGQDSGEEEDETE